MAVCSPVGCYPLLLFGGRLDVQHAESTITIDSWLGLRAPRKVAVLFKLLRFQLDHLLRMKVEVSKISLSLTLLFQFLISCVVIPEPGGGFIRSWSRNDCIRVSFAGQ